MAADGSALLQSCRGLARRTALLALLGATVALAPATAALAGSTAPPGSTAAPTAHPDGGDVRLNELQVIGTHNSYHLEPTHAEKAIRSAFAPAEEPALEYTHAALDQQLGGQAVRQVEFDLFADPEGGRYATPLLRRAAGEPPYDPVMLRPGTKVLHVQDVDYHSTCLTLVACLTEVRDWSHADRGHVPIAILLELKDAPLRVPGQPTVVPVRWDRARMLDMEREIHSVFTEREMITPDDVRRPGRTLEESVRAGGWPTLAAARGKVLFLMDNVGGFRADYVRGNPNLEGRVLFTNANPGDPDAAFVERNDPTGSHTGEIRDLVRQGYVVRTRADADTAQARTGDTAMRDAALASGAQWVSTDYPVPGVAARFGTDYVAALPGGTVARCNPVNAPPHCRAAGLDRAGAPHGRSVTLG